MKAEVRVSKTGPKGIPVAEVAVPGNITAAQLGGLIQKVATNPEILRVGGLGPCGGCKSGLDINIIDTFPETVEVDY